MTIELIYDATYAGFLSCIFEAFLRKGADVLIKRGGSEIEGGFFPCVEITADATRAVRVERGMARLSAELPMTVYRAWLSEISGMDDDILAALRIAFAENADPLTMRACDCVRRMLQADRKTGSEAHRFLGLVRLSKTSGGLYISDIEPDHDILPLIGNHFHMRFSGQRLVIRDLKRAKAVVSDRNGWYIAELSPHEMGPLPEDITHDVWARYFVAIANPERVNTKLQRAFVPKKYRNNIVEFKASLKKRIENEKAGKL